MNPSPRRNACPSLAAPMQTGDGLLARLNTVSGALSPAALGAIAEAADQHGNGIVEVTRRGSLQIRGLTEKSSIGLARDIEALGLDLRTGVPVETGPLAGLDPEEKADPRPFAERLRTMIGGAGLAERLGPKVSVVIEGGGQLSMRDVLADVRLTAIGRDDGRHWKVAVGGTASTARIVGVADMVDAAAMSIGLLRAIANRGKIGRGKDLLDAEIEGVRVAAGERAAPWNIGAEGGATECRGLPSHKHTESGWTRAGAQAQPATSPVGNFGLKDGRIAIGVGLPFGQAGADPLSSLAQAAEKLGLPEFRLAQGRALLGICPDRAAADAVGQAAARLGFVVDPHDPRLRVIACAGAPACASAHMPTKRIAAELAAVPELFDRSTGTIHISGCEKRCAEPDDPRHTVVGTPGGARLLRGRDGIELAFVASEEAAVALRRVLDRPDVGGEPTASQAAQPNRKAG